MNRKYLTKYIFVTSGNDIVRDKDADLDRVLLKMESGVDFCLQVFVLHASTASIHVVYAALQN